MTKEEFIKLREKEEIPIEVLHEYFMESTRTAIPIDDFERLLVKAVMTNLAVKAKDGNMKKIDYTTIVNRFYSYYNQKFGL